MACETFFSVSSVLVRVTCSAARSLRREEEETANPIPMMPPTMRMSIMMALPRPSEEVERVPLPELLVPLEEVVDLFARVLMKATAPAAASEEVKGLLASFDSAAVRAVSRALCEMEPPLTHSPSTRSL